MMPANVAALLEDLSLGHLHAALDTESVTEWQELKRTALLARLKEKGVDKLSDRQAVANGFGKALRGSGLSAASATPAAPLPAKAAPPPPPPAPPPIRRLPGRKKRILCLHGGASSGPIMKVQLNRFLLMMGDEYDFLFANAPTKHDLDPASPEARVLNTHFEGLPVLRWMNIVDRQTGKGGIVGGGITPTAERKDADGNIRSMNYTAHGVGTTAATNASSATGAAGVATSSSESAPEATQQMSQSITRLSGESHTYVGAGEALRALATFVRAQGPFDGAIGFSQGANLLYLWFCLVEAGVLDSDWAAPRWACLICSTQWGWAEHFDRSTEELATAIGRRYGARTPVRLLMNLS